MKAIDLFLVDNYAKKHAADAKTFSLYEKKLSGRFNGRRFGSHELVAVSALVNILKCEGLDNANLNGFYFSYIIPQISKEFDLLKIAKNLVLNIELKEKLRYSDAKAQLIQNKAYLSHLSRPTFHFTFINQTKKLYMLEENELKETNFKTLIEIIKKMKNIYVDELDNLFKPSNYLVSPFDTPEKFIGHEYFLTSQQTTIKKDILRINSVNFFAINGGAGTGKTLLIYDIAQELSKNSRVLIIHCGNLSSGHLHLSASINNLTIEPIKNYENINYNEYSYVLIDESQRLQIEQIKFLVEKTNKNNLKCIFAIDPQQTLSLEEQKTNVINYINKMPNLKFFKLTGRIRTNRNLATFITCLFNKDLKAKIDGNNIEILFASSIENAKIMLEKYKSESFEFINMTPSKHDDPFYSNFSSEITVQNAIGQEFDNVIVLMNNYFYYKNNCLSTKDINPNAHYAYRNMLYQAITRVKDKLCIIVVENYALFKEIINLIS